jgi:hypothetical protein
MSAHQKGGTDPIMMRGRREAGVNVSVGINTKSGAAIFSNMRRRCCRQCGIGQKQIPALTDR